MKLVILLINRCMSTGVNLNSQTSSQKQGSKPSPDPQIPSLLFNVQINLTMNSNRVSFHRVRKILGYAYSVKGVLKDSTEVQARDV